MSEIFLPPLIVNYVTYFRFPVPKSGGGKRQSRRAVMLLRMGSEIGQVVRVVLGGGGESGIEWE